MATREELHQWGYEAGYKDQREAGRPLSNVADADPIWAEGYRAGVTAAGGDFYGGQG